MTTTNSEQTDAPIFAMIASCAELWDSTPDLDARAVKLRRAGKLAEAAELDRRRGRLVCEACELNWAPCPP